MQKIKSLWFKFYHDLKKDFISKLLVDSKRF